jgi:hypothetical protein
MRHGTVLGGRDSYRVKFRYPSGGTRLLLAADIDAKPATAKAVTTQPSPIQNQVI